MKTELALDRQKKVVEGFDAAFTAFTPRVMAGCLNYRFNIRFTTKVEDEEGKVRTKGITRRAPSISSLVPPLACSSRKD